MDFIKQNKTLRLLLVVLIILNVGMLISFWFTRNDRPMTPGENRPMHFLINSVGFDEEQAAQYKALVEQHRQQSKVIREIINKRREELYDYRNSFDRGDLLNQIATLKKEDERLLYQHFTQVRNLCKSQEQRNQFDDSIQEMLQMMQGHGPKRPPHGPPPQRP